MSIWCASFDIGKKNFAFCIEEFSPKCITKIPKIPVIGRYNSDGTTTTKFGTILRDICKNGKIILHKNNDLTNGCKKGIYVDVEMFHNMTDLLEEYEEYWDKCDTFIIEQQMNFGKKRRNPLAVKLGQHCWSYFAINYGKTKKIIEFPAYHKTQVLGAPMSKVITKKGLVKYTSTSGYTRKKWSTDMAISILTERNDFSTISSITSIRKKDDIADTLCQLQAYKVLTYYNTD